MAYSIRGRSSTREHPRRSAQGRYAMPMLRNCRSARGALYHGNIPGKMKSKPRDPFRATEGVRLQTRAGDILTRAGKAAPYGASLRKHDAALLVHDVAGFRRELDPACRERDRELRRYRPARPVDDSQAGEKKHPVRGVSRVLPEIERIRVVEVEGHLDAETAAEEPVGFSDQGEYAQAEVEIA